MDRINEFGLEPGVYEGDGKVIVLVNVINEVYEQGSVTKLQDPLVCYRPLENSLRHVVTAMKMSEFKLTFKLIK